MNTARLLDLSQTILMAGDDFEQAGFCHEDEGRKFCPSCIASHAIAKWGDWAAIRAELEKTEAVTGSVRHALAMRQIWREVSAKARAILDLDEEQANKLFLSIDTNNLHASAVIYLLATDGEVDWGVSV